MIQRIQSLYLFLVFLILTVASLFLQTGYDIPLTINTPLIWETMLVSGLTALIVIFLYRNRKLQFSVNRILILVQIILLSFFVYQSLMLSGENVSTTEIFSEKGIGRLIPVVVIILLALANKAIRKDEQLVKSADRLR